jgi:hypothetical protein
MVYLGVSQELDLTGRRFKSPAQICRLIYRRRGWWPDMALDSERQLCLPYYLDESRRRIVWRGMARWRQSAWRGDWAVIARLHDE